MLIALGKQYNVGEKSIVILYTYINHHAGTRKHNKQETPESGLQYCSITVIKVIKLRNVADLSIDKVHYCCFMKKIYKSLM